jgi:hypothetical protein
MSNAQKTPLSRTLSTFTRQKALDEIAKRGQALPGRVVSVSGPIVTISFEVSGITLPQVTMPLFGPEYIRYPVQVGDQGVAFPASVYLGGVSGLGGGTADSRLRANLATLVWFPIANKNWSAVDPNAVTIYGPNGVVLRDSNSQSVETLTPSSVAFATPVVSTTQNLSSGTGWSGVFTTTTGLTVTVQDGIIVNAA